MEENNPSFDFYFTLTPEKSQKFKLSIYSIKDCELNPTSLAMVHVSALGFGLTVRNSDSKLAAKVFLNSTALDNFVCKQNFVGKMVSVFQLWEVMQTVSLGDSVTVLHVASENRICFYVGNAPAKQYYVGILGNDDEFQEFPDIEYTCETVLMSSTLRQMLNRLSELQGLNLVSLSIAETQVNMSIQSENPWDFEVRLGDKNFDVKFWTPETEHHAWFELRHLDAMKKASCLGEHFHVLFLINPTRKIILHFNIGDFGSLLFMQKGFLNVQRMMVQHEIGQFNPLLMLKHLQEVLLGGDLALPPTEAHTRWFLFKIMGMEVVLSKALTHHDLNSYLTIPPNSPIRSLLDKTATSKQKKGRHVKCWEFGLHKAWPFNLVAEGIAMKKIKLTAGWAAFKAANKLKVEDQLVIYQVDLLCADFLFIEIQRATFAKEEIQDMNNAVRIAVGSTYKWDLGN